MESLMLSLRWLKVSCCPLRTIIEADTGETVGGGLRGCPSRQQYVCAKEGAATEDRRYNCLQQISICGVLISVPANSYSEL